MKSCEWKRKLRERHRGDWCLVELPMEYQRLIEGKFNGGGLCGCGHRNPPSIAYRRRIVRRQLANELRDEING